MKEFNSGAKKDLSGKLPYHLITKEMMDALAEGLQCGIHKGYEPHNWEKGLPICEGHLGAVLRHIYAYTAAQDYNVEVNNKGEEYKLHHLSNALTHLAMAITQVKRGRHDLDDRQAKDLGELKGKLHWQDEDTQEELFTKLATESQSLNLYSDDMLENYDLSNGKRGPVVPPGTFTNIRTLRPKLTKTPSLSKWQDFYKNMCNFTFGYKD